MECRTASARRVGFQHQTWVLAVSYLPPRRRDTARRDAADPISRDDVAADVDDRAPGDDGVGDGDGDVGGGDLRKISTAPKIAAPNANGVFARVRAGRW